MKISKNGNIRGKSMKIKNFKMKLGSEKEFWSVLMTIRSGDHRDAVTESAKWTDKYLFVKYTEGYGIHIHSSNDKEYYENRDKDVYPELIYDEFIKLYGGEDGR